MSSLLLFGGKNLFNSLPHANCFAPVDLNNRMNSSFSFKSSWYNIHPIIQIDQCKTASEARNWINSSPPQTEGMTTFAFSSVFILNSCGCRWSTGFYRVWLSFVCGWRRFEPRTLTTRPPHLLMDVYCCCRWSTGAYLARLSSVCGWRRFPSSWS